MNKRTITLSVRVDQEEKTRLDETAKTAGMRTASFLRACGLNRKITAPLGKEVRNSIRTLSSNLNQLAYGYQATKNTPGVQAVEALKQEARKIVRAIAEQTEKGRN